MRPAPVPVAALVVFVMVAMGLVAGPSRANAAWGAPFEFTKPGSLDVLGTRLAFSPRGASAAGFALEDVDVPGRSQAYVARRAGGGTVANPVAVPGAQQLVDLSFDGSALELLTGVAAGSESCCSAVQAVRMTGDRALEKPRTLVGGLTGPTRGQLLTLGNGGMLAAVGTERGVWVAAAAHGDRFGGQHRLSNGKQIPQSLACAWLGGQSTIVTWTAARGPTGIASPRTIYYATGSRRGPPHKARSLLTVAGGHRIDELGVARRGSGATVAWVESWYDRRGNLHSVVRAADVAASPRIRMLSAASSIASGLDIAANAAGDQAISFKTCRANGSCSSFAAVRGPHATFGAPSGFGLMDPAQSPAVAVGSRGQVIMAWIRSGRPVAAVGSARSRRFGGTKILSSRAQFAADITVAFGPRRQGLAAWSQGTLNPSVVAAAYTEP